jgi:hypothetical protein
MDSPKMDADGVDHIPNKSVWGDLERRFQIILALIAAGGFIIAAAVGGVATYFVSWGTVQHSSPESSPTVTVTLTPTPAPVASIDSFGFHQPGNRVPNCYTYDGTGKVPGDDSVIVFDEAVTPENQQLAVPYLLA